MHAIFQSRQYECAAGRPGQLDRRPGHIELVTKGQPLPFGDLTGTTSRYTRTGDSGKSCIEISAARAVQWYSPNFDVEPDNVSVKACSLDDPSWVTPNFHLYITRKATVAQVERRTAAVRWGFCMIVRRTQWCTTIAVSYGESSAT